jgi:hypothetical protein
MEEVIDLEQYKAYKAYVKERDLLFDLILMDHEEAMEYINEEG